MDNANSAEYLRKIKIQVIENLKRTAFAPSVQMTDVPRDPEGMDDEADAVLDDADEDEHKDTRYTRRRWDKYVEKDGELSESEDEEENQRNGVHRQPGIRRRRNIMDYQNPTINPDDDEDPSGAVTPVHNRRRLGDDLAMSHAAAAKAAAGFGHSSVVNGDESGADSDESHNTSGSPLDEDLDDGDIDMAEDVDEPAVGLAQPHQSLEGAQEATPPDSDVDTAANPVVPATTVPPDDNRADGAQATAEDHGERELESMMG